MQHQRRAVVHHEIVSIRMPSCAARSLRTSVLTRSGPVAVGEDACIWDRAHPRRWKGDTPSIGTSVLKTGRVSMSRPTGEVAPEGR